jgi:hypothetical protein
MKTKKHKLLDILYQAEEVMIEFKTVGKLTEEYKVIKDLIKKIENQILNNNGII